MKSSYQGLEVYLRTHFDIDRIDRIWATQNYRPADHLPYIGTSVGDSNVYIATGFAADGLVCGTAAGSIISDLINGKENRWAKLYNSKRFTPVVSAKTIIKENFQVGKELLKDYPFYDSNTELSQLKNEQSFNIVRSKSRSKPGA
ncbi:FAD-binding oxidoreductase [Cyclobacterium jeungdonense]|uniref:FAD-binding oxidoreductase n=1 Tax=Cyclobacterium jeungdonense TaxID=708087 RepID=A0ABT8C906_9BACT|nr:FAD-binding oxidoreductase [Cyclobacterium jeungdonense]MDN3688557.1 FAD-binding oxidoreductase [Cyclobacterium jeungdonense]